MSVPNQRIVKVHRDMPGENEGNFFVQRWWAPTLIRRMLVAQPPFPSDRLLGAFVDPGDFSDYRGGAGEFAGVCGMSGSVCCVLRCLNFVSLSVGLTW